MTTSEAERAAMRRALELAVTPGVPLGPNPRVGCVLLAPDGTTIAEGFHRKAGGPHAEVVPPLASAWEMVVAPVSTIPWLSRGACPKLPFV